LQATTASKAIKRTPSNLRLRIRVVINSTALENLSIGHRNQYSWQGYKQNAKLNLSTMTHQVESLYLPTQQAKSFLLLTGMLRQIIKKIKS